MPTFSNTAQLEAYVKHALEDVILKDLYPIVQNEWLRVMYKNVYNVYSPTVYERRQHEDGLGDPDNIIISLNKDTGKVTEFLMENIAKGNGWDEYKGKLINHMIEGVDGFAGNPAEGMPARPYTEETVAEIVHGITSESFKYALSNGLKRHGLTINIK